MGEIQEQIWEKNVDTKSLEAGAWSCAHGGSSFLPKSTDVTLARQRGLILCWLMTSDLRSEQDSAAMSRCSFNRKRISAKVSAGISLVSENIRSIKSRKYASEPSRCSAKLVTIHLLPAGRLIVLSVGSVGQISVQVSNKKENTCTDK